MLAIMFSTRTICDPGNPLAIVIGIGWLKFIAGTDMGRLTGIIIGPEFSGNDPGPGGRPGPGIGGIIEF